MRAWWFWRQRVASAGWMRGAIAGLLLILTVTWAGASDASITATVDYAKSGNALELLFELSPEHPATVIRLADIQAPAPDQAPWGEAARNCLADLDDQIVRVSARDWTLDSYQRIWADVWLGQELINRRMLAQGCGYLDSDRTALPDHYRSLVYAQEAARILGLGIWDPNNPLRETPATFRQRSQSP